MESDGAGGKPFENLKNVRTGENLKKILRTSYFLPTHAENRGKIQRLKKEQKCEMKQLIDTLGGANRLKRKGRAYDGKAMEEKPIVEKRRWKNVRESYGGKATVEMRRKAFTEDGLFFWEGKLEN